MRRELTIALRARVTWLVAAAGALLVGHGFMLAIDLYSASSRSALASRLQVQQMDPLAGIVRPTLGGVSLALSVLGPIIAARALAIEKERKSYGALCLAVGSSTWVVAQKALASALACGLLLLAPLGLFGALRLCGGHVDAIETGLALAGEVLHLALVVALATAAAAWTRSFGQAVTLGILASLTSWAIDAAEGFAALAWLGGAAAWSIEQRLLPFQRGILSLSSVVWLLAASVTGLGWAVVGGSFATPGKKAVLAMAVGVVGALALLSIGSGGRGLDWSEQRRASLPPEIVAALRSMTLPMAIEVYLDRDDSRRRQLDSDALAKLRLARPDVPIRMPLDELTDVAEAQHAGDSASGYGRIVVRAGSEVRENVFHQPSRDRRGDLERRRPGDAGLGAPSVPGLSLRPRGRSAPRARLARLPWPALLPGPDRLGPHPRENDTMRSLEIFLASSWLVCACERPVAPAPSGSSAGAAAVTAAAPDSPAALSAAAPPPPTPAPAPPASAAGPAESLVRFDSDPVGAPSPVFEGVVGDWYVANESGARGLEVDGGKWRNGTPSVNLADQAKRLYGDRYAEFLDGVKAFAFFPFAVWKGEPPAGDLRVSVRFFPIAGRVDQAAGIAFGISPEGTYLGVRANALEDNLLYFRIVKGKRTILDTIRNVPTPTKTWHTLSVQWRGKALTVELDGQKRFDKTLDAPPRGRIGLWSKADSQVLFDDFEVESLAGAAR